jgi:hypothetical protein
VDPGAGIRGDLYPGGPGGVDEGVYRPRTAHDHGHGRAVTVRPAAPDTAWAPASPKVILLAKSSLRGLVGLQTRVLSGHSASIQPDFRLRQQYQK